jgi:predicted ATPase/class 3 adenylate cyclase
MSGLPSGTVTFLATDIEGSTRRWEEDEAAMRDALARHDGIIRTAVGIHGGNVFKHTGDGMLAVFASAGDAIAAAVRAQRDLRGAAWGSSPLAVRMAIHSGETHERDGDYFGPTLNRVARLLGVAHGEQILISGAAAALALDHPANAVDLVDVGEHRLRDLDRPERVFQACSAGLRRDFPPLRAAASELRGFPATRTRIIGRDRLLARVTELLGRASLVTLTGVGGSGKTRLAIEAGRRAGKRFADGAAFVDLAPLAEVELIARAVASSAGVPDTGAAGGAAARSAADDLVAYLAPREMLVVLDNCEHLIDGCAELVDRLLAACPRVKVLATSREGLAVEGETILAVPPLELPGEDRSPADSAAVQLFVERAEAARAGGDLLARHLAAVVDICRRLDGIPLALELAAARVRTLSLERLAEGLDDRFRLLTGGARTAVERQRTLLASVEWSHELLDEEERTLFRRLSVFAAPFTVDAAEAVAADEDLDAFAVLDLLAHLVDKSLVAHDGDRYRMLETIRQYAQVRSDEARELELLRDRHLEWFQGRAESWGLHREVATLRQLAEVSLEMPDLVAATEWSAARHRRLPSALMHALGQTWGAADRFHEASTVGRRLLGALEPDTLGWLEGLAPLANLMVLGGDLAWQEPARRLLDGEPPGLDPVARGFVEGALWLPAAYFGSSEALARVEAAAELGRELGNVWLEASVRVDLALLRADR